MFAVVASGIQAICRTQRKLDSILAVYPYPKFCKCATEEEARKWIREHSRSYNSINIKNYGETAKEGYATAEYYIYDNTIYYNVFTDKIGYIKYFSEGTAKAESRRGLIKMKVENIRLNDQSIVSHCIAIRRLLTLLGDFIDVNIVVPDISVYLAATKYKGNNYIIVGLQRDISKRLGGVSFTVR